ncbi:MAG: HD domain-containing protein [Gammaproteobacteria bacterium]|jgi:HD-GYP domain-containing protein (c-di-GMP phosphodiesterase class II)|nr:HD domain-containing protein [Gammaproteobacteria bacterium]MBT4812424.1 HD domain-containing protein [Thiotrichales bacterium]MBT3473964.1 HD domain-containing protein [Gammaproteobacteria bacterium]MBT3966315.1 HD domain-containing protein [Gammaproteobacteria bacterium]MBT4331257.1 HD domain-containing protein [Gammaproteobacteria bacterium]
MSKKLESLLELSKSIIHIENINALLDQLLYQTRRECKADAGSIYLVEEGKLRFSYVQNYTLALREENDRQHLYIDKTIPLNTESIAGYAASTEKTLNIPDVYNLPDDVSYHYNNSFDKATGYQTLSILTSPILTASGDLIGVIQLINKEDSLTFDEEDCDYIKHACDLASGAIERAHVSNETFMRMLRVAELRDPKETGAHVKRVGAYSVELYDAWARKQGISDSEIRITKDPLSTAAMLHDIGKIAISDKILKKPGRLNEEEFTIMKSHAAIGANLFSKSHLTIDRMACDIIGGHHERWDGDGYPAQLKGNQIPLTARIVALADVYDALISKRVYKEAWDEQEVLDYLAAQSGSQFDPELVELFLSIQDTIRVIRRRYQG